MWENGRAQIPYARGWTRKTKALALARANGRWIHSAYDPIKEAQAWAESQNLQEGETIVVLGVGLLYQVEALCARLPRTAPVVLVVPDLSVLVDAAAVRTWGDWMDRVSWAWGAPEAIGRQIAASTSRSCPAVPGINNAR